MHNQGYIVLLALIIYIIEGFFANSVLELAQSD